MGDVELAERWLNEAKTYSEEHGNNQISFQASAALEALSAGEFPAEGAGAGTQPVTIEDIDGLRSELTSMRDQLGSMAGASVP